MFQVSLNDGRNFLLYPSGVLIQTDSVDELPTIRPGAKAFAAMSKMNDKARKILGMLPGYGA